LIASLLDFHCLLLRLLLEHAHYKQTDQPLLKDRNENVSEKLKRTFPRELLAAHPPLRERPHDALIQALPDPLLAHQLGLPALELVLLVLDPHHLVREAHERPDVSLLVVRELVSLLGRVVAPWRGRRRAVPAAGLGGVWEAAVLGCRCAWCRAAATAS
jgi:hypothetical protein